MSAPWLACPLSSPPRRPSAWGDWSPAWERWASKRVPEAERLSPLTSVAVPEGVEDAAVRRFLLEQLSLEIGGGLGPMQSNTWRIGLMGAGATRRNVSLCLAGLGAALRDQGHQLPGDALAAAAEVYD